MHVPINVTSSNNISKWQMGFNSAFKGLIYIGEAPVPDPSVPEIRTTLKIINDQKMIEFQQNALQGAVEDFLRHINLSMLRKNSLKFFQIIGLIVYHFLKLAFSNMYLTSLSVGERY
jgi:hypothetical protein